jgi:hypothetical protein
MAYDPSVEYVLPEPTSSELSTLQGQLLALDPDNAGIAMSQLRVFYPKLGWGHMQKRMEALVASGFLRSEIRPNGSGVGIQYYVRNS